MLKISITSKIENLIQIENFMLKLFNHKIVQKSQLNLNSSYLSNCFKFKQSSKTNLLWHQMDASKSSVHRGYNPEPKYHFFDYIFTAVNETINLYEIDNIF